jgi:hypothetical protein
VTNPPIFAFSFTPISQITPGEKFTVEGVIMNTGGSISKVVLSVNSTSFFFDRQSQISLGDLASGNNISVQLPIIASASVQPGVQSIPLLLSYQDPLGAAQQELITVSPVRVAKSSVDFLLEANAEKNIISPGGKTTMLVNLTNIGNSDAYSARITLSSTSAYFTSLGSSERFFEKIPAGSKEQMEFDVGVNGTTPAGYYPVTVTVNYLDINGEMQTPIQKQIGVEVGDVPQISITPSANPSPVAAGGVYMLSLQFSNIGNINIRALSVNASSESFEILSSSYSYIGSLNLDDYSSVDYTIHSNNNLQPGNYPIHITMTFRDAYNTEHVVTQDVPIEIVPQSIVNLTEKPAGMSLTSIFIIIIIIAAIGYLAYTRYYKKKGK